jgi:hypothetical protein
MEVFDLRLIDTYFLGANIERFIILLQFGGNEHNVKSIVSELKNILTLLKGSKINSGTQAVFKKWIKCLNEKYPQGRRVAMEDIDELTSDLRTCSKVIERILRERENCNL